MHSILLVVLLRSLCVLFGRVSVNQEEKLSRMKLRNLIMLPITVFVNAFAGLTVSSIFYFGENQISQVSEGPRCRHIVKQNWYEMRDVPRGCISFR